MLFLILLFASVEVLNVNATHLRILLIEHPASCIELEQCYTEMC